VDSWQYEESVENAIRVIANFEHGYTAVRWIRMIVILFGRAIRVFAATSVGVRMNSGFTCST
jgi:hypothetical protein